MLVLSLQNPNGYPFFNQGTP